MANYAVLKAAIENVIKTNGNNEITGQLLQNSLIAMINALGADCQFAGVATPETNPGTPDQNVMYIAGAGTYPNFGPTTVKLGEIGVFTYKGIWQYVTFPTDTTNNVVNINQIANHPSYYTTLQDAFADVPERYRKPGCITSFYLLDAEGVPSRVAMMYIGDDTEDWEDADYWLNMGPVYLRESYDSDDYWVLQIGLDSNFKIIDSLQSFAKSHVLSANQGRVLNEKIEGYAIELESIGITSEILPRPILKGSIITKIDGATKLIFGSNEVVTTADLPYKTQNVINTVKTESGTATDVTIGVRGVVGIDFINVNDYYGHSAAYGSASLARTDVAATERKKGLYITYLLADGWHIEQFIGSDIANWNVDNNWVAPVSVTQNTETGKTELKIGSEAALIEDNIPEAESNNLVSSNGVRTLINRNMRGLMMSDSLYKTLLLGTETDITPSELTSGVVKADGTIGTSTSLFYADITLEDGYVYNIAMWNGGSSNWYGITLYDANDVVLFNQNKGISGHFVFPNTAVKLRICNYSAHSDVLSITKQAIQDTSGLLTLIANNKTLTETVDGKVSDNLYYEGIDRCNNIITPPFNETAGSDNVTNGYYDKDGVFHADSNYKSREYSVKKGCAYLVSCRVYGGQPTLVALDANNNVLFYKAETLHGVMMFSDKVAKILLSTNKSWSIILCEQYDHNDLNTSLKSNLKFKTGNNVFNADAARSGYSIRSGYYGVYPNSSFSGYAVGEVYNLYGATKMHIILPTNYTNCAYSAIDKYGNLIADHIAVSSSDTIDITDADRILIIYKLNNATIMVNFGNNALPYEPYYEYYDIVVANAQNSQHSAVADTLSDDGVLAPIESNLGTQKKTTSVASLNDDKLELTNYPQYVKKSNTTLLDAKITSFNEIVVGIGSGGTRGSQIRITTDKIFFQDGTKTDTTGSYSNVAHGLTITTFIKVMYKVSFGRLDYIISTLGGYYKGYYEKPELYNENYGRPFVSADASTTLTDVILGGTSPDFKRPVWVIGDSYVSLHTSKRWPYYPIKEWDYKNWLLQGRAGGTSNQLYDDLGLSLAFGTPKYLVWCLGMNDADEDINIPNESWLTTVQDLISLCNQKNITLILATIPNTANRINTAKNNWIKASGNRYIDFAKAVNGEVYTSGVDNWYAGYNDDGTHPTALGAEALATQFITDFPEVLQYE